MLSEREKEIAEAYMDVLESMDAMAAVAKGGASMIDALVAVHDALGKFLELRPLDDETIDDGPEAVTPVAPPTIVNDGPEGMTWRRHLPEGGEA